MPVKFSDENVLHLFSQAYIRALKTQKFSFETLKSKYLSDGVQGKCWCLLSHRPSAVASGRFLAIC
jgi:hypothetical protein